MAWTRVRTGHNDRRSARRGAAPACETLEGRMVLNAAGAAQLANAMGGLPIHESRAHPRPVVLGTISGQATDTTGKGLRNVRVALINANGRVVQTAMSGRNGTYSFKITQDGPYVVHALSGNRLQQIAPTFPNEAPTGALVPGAGGSSWTYTGTNTNPASGPVDPFAWDTIAPAGDLPFESPINITTPPTDLSKVLTINYSPAVPTQIVNNGHQFQVQYTPASTTDTINVAGVTYDLAQFHYHAPSETTVNGQSSAIEEHFVNTSAAGGETVLAVFLQVGAHNDALDPILNAAAANLAATNSKTPGTTPVNFAELLPQSMQGWFYEGSLTTPPLSQPVNWFVFATPITLDAQQLAKYQQLAGAAGFDPNARPVQPLDGRQLNEMNYDVNFQDQSVNGMNFVFNPTTPPRRNPRG